MTDHESQQASQQASQQSPATTARTIAYWASTAVLAFGLFAGGAANFVGAPAVRATLAHLGYPAYFATLIGAWKLLGALAVLAPGQPRLKEWAYAGVFFVLTGATISHAAAGDPLGQIVPPLVLLAFATASWALRPAARRLPAATVAARPAPAELAPLGRAA